MKTLKDIFTKDGDALFIKINEEYHAILVYEEGTVYTELHNENDFIDTLSICFSLDTTLEQITNELTFEKVKQLTSYIL